MRQIGKDLYCPCLKSALIIVLWRDSRTLWKASSIVAVGSKGVVAVTPELPSRQI